MHQHLAQVHQYPLAAALSLATQYFLASLLELDHYIIGKRFGLPGGIGAGDDHALKQGTEFAGIYNGDVLCFNIFKCSDNEFGFFFSG